MSEEKTLFIQNDNPMNVAARKKAFQATLIKWESILYSLCPLLESYTQCELCLMFRVDNYLSELALPDNPLPCSQCPMKLVELCGDSDSTYRKLIEFLRSIKTDRQLSFKMIPWKISDCTPEEQETLKTLCRKIIENIEKARIINER